MYAPKHEKHVYKYPEQSARISIYIMYDEEMYLPKL